MSEIDDIARRITGYATLRWDIMKLADEEGALRSKLIEVQTQKNLGITKLVEFADHIFTKALPEYDTEGKLKKEYRYEQGALGAKVEVIAEFTNPRERRCSNEWCREVGHTAPNCPNLKPETPVVKSGKKKRVMKPLSPERKAQLAETLKKAREAKGKKEK